VALTFFKSRGDRIWSPWENYGYASAAERDKAAKRSLLIGCVRSAGVLPGLPGRDVETERCLDHATTDHPPTDY